MNCKQPHQWRSESERVNQYAHARTMRTQEVRDKFAKLIDAGPVDPARREAGSKCFLTFCKSYFPQAFCLPWSKDHIEAAQRIQEVAANGACFAYAMPRGSGKTTFARAAVNWATLYGYSPYCVLICKTKSSAVRMLKSLKTTLRFTQELLEDFPEAIAPFRHINGESRRCSGQTYAGEATGIQWSAEQIVFAKVPGAMASEAIIDVVGIEGEIRGRQFERQDGSIVRPTFVVVDDPQDRESARSHQTCDQREQTIKADVMYLAGPDRPTGVIMPCTVIYKDDLADRMLDRERNPEWHGKRTKFLVKHPSDGLPAAESKRVYDKWSEYFTLRHNDFKAGGDGSVATEFYRQNQQVMDGNGETSWPERFMAQRGEISAIQHAMNQIDASEEAFRAEYQNEPIDASEKSLDMLNIDILRERVGTVPRGIVPPHIDTLTAYIDVSKKVLWWMVCGWHTNTFTGAVLDYGVFPEQRGTYVTLNTVRQTLEKASSLPAEQSLAWGLEELCREILGRDYVDDVGTVHKVKRCLIDTNWQESTPVVNAFCLRSGFKNILYPSRGHGVVTPGDGLLRETDTRPGTRVGLRWKIIPAKGGYKWVQIDTNFWKTFAANRIRTRVPKEGEVNGGLTFCAEKRGHRMLFEQLTAEAPTRKLAGGMTFDHWKQKPASPDNHLLDCLTGCSVAASIEGVSLSEHQQPVLKRQKRKVKVNFG